MNESRRGVEILEDHAEESMSVYEVLDEVHAQKSSAPDAKSARVLQCYVDLIDPNPSPQS